MNDIDRLYAVAIALLAFASGVCLTAGVLMRRWSRR